MKDKILFLTDGWFFNFGVAYYLQKLKDYEFYAIFDVDDKARNFYENQNLVKYKKKWFYLDGFNSKNLEPDLNYLSEFEEKYHLNLWSIIYSDREFYPYNNFHHFTDNEILSILEHECKFFEKILDEVSPQFVSMYIPITHYQELFYQLCKAKRIKILIFSPVRFGGRMNISEEAGMSDDINKIKKIEGQKPRNFKELREFLNAHNVTKAIENYKKAHFESHRWQRYYAILKFFLSLRSENYYLRYSHYGKTRLRTFYNKLTRSLKRKFRESFMNRTFSKNTDKIGKFVFFALSSEPERQLLIKGNFHTNQLAVIQNIAKALPIDYKLVVKEHPVQNIYGWRPISYYKEIFDIPNVVMVHHSLSSEQIIEKSSLVISIVGTVSQEAAFYGKPSIVFADTLFLSMPSVSKVEKISDLPEIIRTSLKKEVNYSDVDEFVQKVERSSFEYVINELMEDFSFRFGFKGPIMDATMPENKVKSFLEVHRLEFEKLSLEHQKKIQTKKMETEGNLNKI